MNKNLKAEYYQRIFVICIPSYGGAARIVVRTTITNNQTVNRNKLRNRKTSLKKPDIVGADTFNRR